MYMTLREKILSEIKEAMRNRDQVRLDSLRFVWARAKELEIDKKSELSDAEIEALIAREVKARREAIIQFQTAGRDDLVLEEEKKLDVLVELLPEQLAESELVSMIDTIISQTENPNFGVVMGKMMGLVQGRADGSLVSRLVKSKLAA